MGTFGNMPQKYRDWLDGKGTRAGSPLGMLATTIKIGTAVGDVLDRVDDLASQAASKGAALVGVAADGARWGAAGNLYAILQAVWDEARGSTTDSFTDTTNKYTTDQVGPAFAELATWLGVPLSGLTTTDKASIIAAINEARAKASTASGTGATGSATTGIAATDAGGTGATGASATGATVDTNTDQGVRDLGIPATKSTTAVHAAFAANDASNDFPGPFTAPDKSRNLTVTFGAGWDGGDVTVTGQDAFGGDLVEVFASNPGNTVVGTKVFAEGVAVTATKAAQGASGDGASIGTGDKLGWGLSPGIQVPVGILSVDGLTEAATWDSDAGEQGVTPTSLPNGARRYLAWFPTTHGHGLTDGGHTHTGPSHTHPLTDGGHSHTGPSHTH